MTAADDTDCDVLIIGAGIAGLGAALELKELGLRVKVLEKEARVGGRMTTDRVGGFAIDRGATIFGQQFQQMHRVVKKLGLESRKQYFNFAFGLKDESGLLAVKRSRLDSVVCSRKFSWKAKMAMARFTLDVLRQNKRLNHGYSPGVTDLDRESAQQYMARIGGEEFLSGVLLPGLNGPLGGVLASNSRLILFHAFWNILVQRTWAIRGGLDQIPEAMAREVEVVKNCAVRRAEVGVPCRVEACENGEPVSLRARGVIFAIPGNLVPALCADFPPEARAVLEKTRYSAMTSAHVLLSRAPDTEVTGYGVAESFDYGYEIELEHNRVAGLCPEGKAIASVYFWDEGETRISACSDEELCRRVTTIIENCFPECRDHIAGIHLLRWQEGIGQFPPGRLSELAALRQSMAHWDLPLQLAGDYLDGISTEGALFTGQEAACNLARRLRASVA